MRERERANCKAFSILLREGESEREREKDICVAMPQPHASGYYVTQDSSVTSYHHDFNFEKKLFSVKYKKKTTVVDEINSKK